MTRFQVLSLLTRIPHEADLRGLCMYFSHLSKGPHWYSRSFREALRTQLARLASYGLVSRRWERGSRNARGNYGEFVYRITARGKARLKWITRSAALQPREQTTPPPRPPA